MDTEEPSLALSCANTSFEMEESSEETISRILVSYDIGTKLRRLRLKKKIGLVDLGRHTGLSASMLSQLENGKLLPTLPTLARIAMVFDVGLEYFFGQRKGRKLFAVIRAGERMRFPERSDKPNPAYFFECLAFSAQEKSLQAYFAEFPPRAAHEVTEHFHDGSEFLFMLEGSLTVRFEGEDHTLDAGDALYFDASEPHSYRGAGENGARAVVITAPPRI
jgi:transcriptional regulator with XRE-family HTH domain